MRDRGFKSTQVVPAVDALLTARYEELRQEVLAGQHAGPAIGRAVLLRSGMAGWMEACAQVPPQVPQLPERTSGPGQLLLGAGLRHDVAVLLAEMAISLSHQEVSP